MRENNKLKIAIVWEGIDSGGVDSYLAYLLNAWPNDDEIVIFYNKQNRGIDRLKDLLLNENVKFHQVKQTIHYFDGSTYFSWVLKFIIYSLTPLLFLIGVFRYLKAFNSYNFDILIAQNGGYPGSYGVISSLISGSLSLISVKTLVIHHAAIPSSFGHGWFRYLIEQYINDINKILNEVNKDKLFIATQIASVPEIIRGYGHIKEENIIKAQEKRKQLLENWKSSKNLKPESDQQNKFAANIFAE